MMANNQDLNLTRAERRKFIIRMRGQGYQLKEIAEVIGSSTSQVSYDLKLIKAVADEEGVCDEVGTDVDELLTKKMKAEFDRIKKAQAEVDSEMARLVDFSGHDVLTLSKWFIDEPEDAPDASDDPDLPYDPHDAFVESEVEGMAIRKERNERNVEMNEALDVEYLKGDAERESEKSLVTGFPEGTRTDYYDERKVGSSHQMWKESSSREEE
jgi:DNA-binding transcriptional MerR regulator